MKQKTSIFFQMLKKAYVSFSLILSNTVYLFLLLNMVLGVIFFVKDKSDAQFFHRYYKEDHLFLSDGRPIDTGRRSSYQLKWFDFNACKEIGEKYASEVLDDFYHLQLQGFVYQPWGLFSEPIFSGKRLNVVSDEAGFPLRKTINPSVRKKPTVRIFAFGGSTTFGYNVADEHTWSSFLSKALNERSEKEKLPFRIEVSNYGRGTYYPSSETMLLIQLLKSGHRPSLVIFLDGINWGEKKDIPLFTKKAATGVLLMQHGINFQNFVGGPQWIPVVRLVQSMNFRLRKLKLENDTYRGPSVERAIIRFEQNRNIVSALCKLYGCKTLFFLQPSPRYQYDLKLYRSDLQKRVAITPYENLENTKILYEELKQKNGYVDLSYLFQRWGNRKVFVDDEHYSPAFNQFLAQQILQYINLRELKLFNQVFNESAST